MREEILLYISGFLSIVGIIGLYFLSFMIEPSRMKISEIGYDKLGTYSKITGTVVSVYRHPKGHIFMSVDDQTESIKVVIFSDTVKRIEASGIEINELDNVTVVGLIDEYKGDLELVAEDVEIV